MNQFFRRLPLLAKLLVITIVPLAFILFLTIQLYNEKSRNVQQIKSYLDRINRSFTITRLIDQLQKERKFSFDYTLLKTNQVEMISERPVTDSLLTYLQKDKGKTLTGFEEYVFLENIDSVRNKIDTGRYPPNQVMHFYSSAIFRFSTLNKTPDYTNQFLAGLSEDLTSQRLLSEMLTYLGIISANIYNLLYTKQYVLETLLGTLPSYDIYKSYEKELLIKSAPQTLQKYKIIRENSALKPAADYVNGLFFTYKIDSSYTHQEWSDLSDKALNEIRSLQMGLLKSAEETIHQYYNNEVTAKSRTIVFLIATSVLLILLAIFILVSINQSLKELRNAAVKIADGETGIKIKPMSNDAVGSLANSILKIDEKNIELSLAAKRIGAGDFSIPLHPRSEKDLLGNAIIRMKENLESFTNDVKKSREEFKMLADFMPQIVWTAQPDGIIDYYNKNWYEITGAKEGFGDQSWIPILHPADVGPCLNTWYHSVETGAPYQIEYRFKDVRSGNYRWFLGRALPIRDEHGNIVKWFGTGTDIHDQKVQNEKLEEIVEERTIELTRSNEDLQQFAHVASHDLKEPLRKIRTFIDRFGIEYGNLIPEKGKIYMQKVQASSERMTNMIDSVLSYSVINATEQTLQTVDLNMVIDGIANDLELLILQKEAKIFYLNLPKIRASSTLIYQLFYNLINNALKFSKEATPTQIHLSAKEVCSSELKDVIGLPKEKKFWEILIKDNGIGFNQAYADKMFHVFTRLNTREKYEGTGLGLALCKKIVHRHQGFIYAEGKEGEGAVFHILIPV
ncbi:MAG: PAS domain-containing protein [Flavisolibacter sp.]|nr:PAS domain-containing protein [Flavisolibacter sp.]